MTLTDGSGGQMTVADLYKSWNRLALALRREGVLREYAAVVETTEGGALHLHLLATGEFIPQRRLSALAARSGFGRVADVRAVKNDVEGERAAAYIAKEVAAYVSKGKAEALASKTAQRRRPLRTSRGWGLSLAAAEKLLAAERATEGAERDVGPWLHLQALADGSLRVRGGGDDLPRLLPPETSPNGSEVATGAARRLRAVEPLAERASASATRGARASEDEGEDCGEEGGREVPFLAGSEKARARDGPVAHWAA